MVTLTIDGVRVRAKKGTKLLWAALDSGIYIPNLCGLRETNPPLANCRLCFVEIEGRHELVTACTESVAQGMVVHTNTPRVARIRHTAFDLLMSRHPVVCATCPRNGDCELQRIAFRLGFRLKQKRFPNIPRSLPVDSSHPLFTYDPNLCVLCGKCVWVCQERGKGILNFAFRGIDTMVSTFGNAPLAESNCDQRCAECVAVCPVGALVAKRPPD